MYKARFPLDFSLCYFLSPVVTNPKEKKYKGKENLQHIITQNNYGVETDLIYL